jgi:hypothetical protein
MDDLHEMSSYSYVEANQWQLLRLHLRLITHHDQLDVAVVWKTNTS